MTIEEKYEAWLTAHRKSLGWQLQYEDIHDRVFAAFIAGYELARKEEKQNEHGE